MIQKFQYNNEKRQLIFILLSFGFYSLSRGIWYNYQNLWMQENQLPITTISVVVGLASLLSVSVLFLFSNLIKRKDIPTFVISLMILKLFSLLCLFLLNDSGHAIFIKFLIMFDLVIDTCVVTCMYPVLSFIKKSDTLYSMKGIVTNSGYDLGVFFSGFFLGKMLLGHSISYNYLLFIAILFLGISCFIMKMLQIESREEEEFADKIQIRDFFQFLKQDGISKWYLLAVLLGDICYYAIVGLRMLVLTDIVLVDVHLASHYLFIVGIVSDLLAFLILKYFTSKKFWINVFVKFGGRVLLCGIAFLTNSSVMIMITIFYALLFSPAYSHVTDAPYINRISQEFQLSFINLKSMCSYLGQAIGVWLCGFFIQNSIRCLFLVVPVFLIGQIVVMLYCYKLRTS